MEVVEKEGRNWHFLQESHMLSVMERFKQYRPIKGTKDGKMANRFDVVWTPIASIMNKDNGCLLVKIASLGKG